MSVFCNLKWFCIDNKTSNLPVLLCYRNASPVSLHRNWVWYFQSFQYFRNAHLPVFPKILSIRSYIWEKVKEHINVFEDITAASWQKGSSRALCLRVSPLLLALWSPCLGKRELVCVLLVHLFVCFVHASFFFFFFFFFHFSLPLGVVAWLGFMTVALSALFPFSLWKKKKKKLKLMHILKILSM